MFLELLGGSRWRPVEQVPRILDVLAHEQGKLVESSWRRLANRDKENVSNARVEDNEYW